jgi:hypothetical protein
MGKPPPNKSDRKCEGSQQGTLQAGVMSRRRQGINVRYELVDFTCWWVVQQLASGLVRSAFVQVEPE